jgi:hypothetical protein
VAEIAASRRVTGSASAALPAEFVEAVRRFSNASRDDRFCESEPAV